MGGTPGRASKKSKKHQTGALRLPSLPCGRPPASQRLLGSSAWALRLPGSASSLLPRATAPRLSRSSWPPSWPESPVALTSARNSRRIWTPLALPPWPGGEFGRSQVELPLERTRLFHRCGHGGLHFAVTMPIVGCGGRKSRSQGGLDLCFEYRGIRPRKPRYRICLDAILRLARDRIATGCPCPDCRNGTPLVPKCCLREAPCLELGAHPAFRRRPAPFSAHISLP